MEGQGINGRGHGSFTSERALLLRIDVYKRQILCSPHNPVGRVWTEEELLSMAELCRKYGVTVVSDEIHCDFIWPGHHFISWARTAAHCATNYIICTSPSKSFNLAGMQTANIIIPDETCLLYTSRCV